MHGETIPDNEYTLISPLEEWKTSTISNYVFQNIRKQIFKDGELVYNLPSVKERRDYCKRQFETIYDEVKRNYFPHQYYVDLSLKLLNLKKKMIKKVKQK